MNEAKKKRRRKPSYFGGIEMFIKKTVVKVRIDEPKINFRLFMTIVLMSLMRILISVKKMVDILISRCKIIPIFSDLIIDLGSDNLLKNAT